MKRILFFFLLFLALLWGISRHPEFFLLQEAMKHKTVDTDLLLNTDSSLGYVLSDDSWISFPLTPNIKRIKVITNAGVSKENSLINDIEYHYTLEYEIRGGQDNEPLQHGSYYHLSHLTHYMNPGAEQAHIASLYLNPDIIPVDGRAMTINPEEWSSPQQAKEIRLRLVKKDREVTDVLLRIYKIEQNAQAEELYNWQRLSIPKRVKQARGNVYPYDFLSDEEKINLINRRWRPIGPLGIPGKDYHVRNLYTIKDHEEEPVIEMTPPVLPSVGPQHVMTLPIPAGGMKLRFSLLPMEEDGVKDAGNVSFNWYGPTATQRSKREVSVHATEETVVESSFEQGLVEIRSERPYTITMMQPGEHGWVEWQPEPLFSRATLCAPQKGVNFSLSDSNNQSTPFRITLRAPLSDMTQREYKIEYELLGSPGGKGSIHFTPQPSMYDRMLVDGIKTQTSEPVSYYWHLPVDVSGIRISSSGPVMVSAATRPPDLSHLIRVPEDYDRTSVSDAGRQPVWFPLLPDGYRDLFRQQRSILIQLQQKPPEDNLDLLAGLYRYESFRPSLQWAGRFLLLPPDQNPGLRQPDPISIFHPLERGINKLNVIDDNRAYSTRPRLVFFRKNKEVTERITLLLDKKPYFSTELHGLSGQINLPSIATGDHRVTVKTQAPDGTELYMNHLQDEEAGSQLRFANRLTSQGLQFDYLKNNNQAERLSFTFFSPAATERTKIRIRLLGRPLLIAEGPSQEFSLLDRHYDVRAVKTESVKVLNLGKKMVGEGMKLFFPLGEDIPPGNYTFSVELNEGPEGYIIFSRITPGIFSSQKLIKEQPLQEPGNAKRE